MRHLAVQRAPPATREKPSVTSLSLLSLLGLQLRHDHVLEVLVDDQRVVGVVENVESGVGQLFFLGLFEKELTQPVAGDVIVRLFGNGLYVVDGTGRFNFANQHLVMRILGGEFLFAFINVDVVGVGAGNGEKEIGLGEVVDNPLRVVVLFLGAVIEVFGLAEQALDITPYAEVVVEVLVVQFQSNLLN